MKLLALDTAMAACSVAVIDTGDADPLAAQWRAMERGHAEAVAPMVQEVMWLSGLSFSDLQRIAVTAGPGTFTGVRIGLAMGRGLGLALGIPVIGIASLAAIAANADAPVLVAADARNGDVYAALYDRDGRELSAPALVAASLACAGVPEGIQIIGTAAEQVIAASGRGDLMRSRAGDLPVAANFARRAALLPDTGNMPPPVYLRQPDAKPQAMGLRRVPAMTFRTLSAADSGLLAALHAECFDIAWTPDDFRKLLAMPGSTAVAAVEHGEPLAFALFRQAADEIEIITIGTRPFAQRRGLARALIVHQLTDDRIASAFIEVAASNQAARALYAACGFAAVGIRRGYYERQGEPREDAIVMRRDKTP